MPNRRQTNRKRAERRGRVSEHIAALWLRLKGYRILEMRAKTPMGEIDIVATKRAVLVFVEVKARETREAALYSVTPAASSRIMQAADYWAARYSGKVDGWRYDIIAMAPLRLPHHVRDAWRPDS